MMADLPGSGTVTATTTSMAISDNGDHGFAPGGGGWAPEEWAAVCSISLSHKIAKNHLLFAIILTQQALPWLQEGGVQWQKQ